MVGFIRDDDEDDISTQAMPNFSFLRGEHERDRLRVEELRDELETIMDRFHTRSMQAEMQEQSVGYDGSAEDARLWRILKRDSKACYAMAYGMWSRTHGD